jgi:predicted nucleic acid-binding protein
VDVRDLLGSDLAFVIDTSAWWRAASVPRELATLLRGALRQYRARLTPVVRMEILYSARSSAEDEVIAQELDVLPMLRNDRTVADAAMIAIGELAARSDGYHRVPPTDALIAAAAAEHGLPVLHEDRHFARLSEVLAFESVRLLHP